MAPGVKIPVIPVIDQPLGGDDPAGEAIFRSVVIAQINLAALQGGRGHGMKIFGQTGARADAVKPETAAHLTRGHILVPQDRLNPLPEQGQFPPEQTGLHAAEQIMNREQGLQLGQAEPEAGQLDLIAIRSVEDIAIEFFVKKDGGSLLFTQFANDPFDGRPGALHALFQLTHGNGITVGMQEGMQRVNTVKLVHHFLRKKDERDWQYSLFVNAIKESNNFMQKHKKTTADRTPNLMQSHIVLKAQYERASCKMIFSPNLFVMLKILSSEYQLYACGKIFRMPRF